MANNENLVPFTGADDPRRMNGRPKGSKNLATIVRELENEEFDWSLVPIKGDKETVKKIGAPWKAIVFTALSKACDGDVKAMEWLRKSGYGDKLDITSKGREIVRPLIMPDIKARYVETEEKTT